MPRFTLAQATAVVITVIVVLGRDRDVLFAVPFGVLAGLLAALFSELAEFRLPRLRFARVRRPQ